MGRIEIRTFDGDLEALRDMAHASLYPERGDEVWLDMNRPAVMARLFEHVPDPRLLIGAYDGTRLVGFLANLPRRYRLNGVTYRGVFTNLLATAPGYGGSTVYLIMECLRQNQAYGADFALIVLERGYSSWRLFEKALAPRYRIERLATLHGIARPIDMPRLVASQRLGWPIRMGAHLIGADRPIEAPAVPGIVRPYAAADLPAIEGLLACCSDAGCLVRQFDRAPLASQLATDDLTATVVYERGGTVRGMINYAIHEHVSPRGRDRWAWIDFVSWDNLLPETRRALLSGLWHDARRRGCIGLMEWSKGYYSPWTLYGARFVPYPLRIDVNAWVFRPGLSLRGVGRLCEQIQ